MPALYQKAVNTQGICGHAAWTLCERLFTSVGHTFDGDMTGYQEQVLVDFCVVADGHEYTVLNVRIECVDATTIMMSGGFAWKN